MVEIASADIPTTGGNAAASCRLRLSGILLTALIALCILPTGSAAAAGPAHVFDPVLSLTGGCTTSGIDPVPDPGCPDPPHPPSGSFSRPMNLVTDAYGNMYVSSRGATPAQGRIDVFDSSGHFITEVADALGPQSLAVDGAGNLYVVNEESPRLVRYTPTLYKPGQGEIAYGSSPTVVVETAFSTFIGLAVDPADQHLFAHFGTRLVEYDSAANENKQLDEFGDLFFFYGLGLALDPARDRVYASDGAKIEVYELAAPHALVLTIDGSTTPAGKFLNAPSVAVDEGTGNVFAYDGEATKVYEFTSSGAYLSTIEHGFQNVFGSQVSVDNGPFSPNGGSNLDGRYLFVPSHLSGVGHTFAFEPTPKECAPAVEAVSFAGVTEREASLRATINPCNLETTYVFEYTTQGSFEAEGFAGAVVAGEGQIPAGNQGRKVATSIEGLTPGASYRFRVRASNSEGGDEGGGEFTTYPSVPVEPMTCPNHALRIGFSALLPDCRAYELVTPPDTNARSPLGIGHLGSYFATREVSPSGGRLSFRIEGGSIPGIEGTGSLAGDPFLSSRGASGWSTAYAGPTAAESPELLLGSTSPDQGYSFWSTAGAKGSASIEEGSTTYVRYPDGHSALVGRGSIDVDPRAAGKLISIDGGHIVFVSGSTPGTTAQQLEPSAPPDGTRAVYDRTADEVTHVVSLLPGDVTPSAGEDAHYVGASLDGRGIAFSIGKTLYLRYDNVETFEIGEDVTFAGIAEGGSRIFYLAGGTLFRFDALTEEILPFNSSGVVVPVNVSADGSAAYFVSTAVLAPELNPNGAEAQAGEQNLYLSKEGAISFVGAVTERDVEGEDSGNEIFDGLGLWAQAVGPGSSELPGRLGQDPSRTTPDGSVLLFQSRADLAGYDPDGFAQVYRYDSVAEELECISCIPTGAVASGGANLQSISEQIGSQEPLTSFAPVNNLRADGRRAFFQSTEALVPGDTDGLQDIYQWEDRGVGSCENEGGCVYLISSGGSRRVDYLYGVSDSGDDVFFLTSDLLLPLDSGETPSIYDARVGGGFPEPKSSPCEGEGCRPGSSASPGLPTALTPVLGRGDNAKPSRRCAKGRHKVKTRGGKTRCVKRKKRKHSHRQGRAGVHHGGGRK